MAKFSVQNGVSGSIKYGNPRGNASTDMQFVRTAADQVASGYASLVGGGAQNKASNFYAAVLGGFGNTSSGVASITAGAGNTASAENSVALGAGNVSAGDASFTLGLDNQALAEASVAIGNGNVASGVGSGIIGSTASITTATGIASLVFGGSAGVGYLPNQVVTSPRGSQYSGGTPEIGTLQVSEIILMGETEIQAGDPFVAFPLSLDGGAAGPLNQIGIYGDNKAWHITCDWMVTSLNQTVAGKDIVIVDKQAGSVTFVEKANINFVGDPALKNELTMGYTAGPGPIDLIVTVNPTGVFVPGGVPSSLFRATAKFTIVEVKTN